MGRSSVPDLIVVAFIAEWREFIAAGMMRTQAEAGEVDQTNEDEISMRVLCLSPLHCCPNNAAMEVVCEIKNTHCIKLSLNYKISKLDFHSSPSYSILLDDLHPPP